MKTGVPDAWRVRSILTSEAYLEGMKTAAAVAAAAARKFVRSLPRRNENAQYYAAQLHSLLSEAYLEGMKTTIAQETSGLQMPRPKPTSKE